MDTTLRERPRESDHTRATTRVRPHECDRASATTRRRFDREPCHPELSEGPAVRLPSFYTALESLSIGRSRVVALAWSPSHGRPRVVAFGRLQLALVVIVALCAFAIRAEAQALQPTAPGAPEHAPAPVPFTVGEELAFHATFGVLPAGTARMRVEGIDTIRGTPAYHVVFVVDGGIPFFRVHDRYESWMSVATLSSLRYTQHISEGRYHRETTYEFFPGRAEFQKNGEPPEPSVVNPLDEGSFIYAARAARIRVGDTLRLARYFVRDRNPVTFIGERADTVEVGAGTFAAIVVRPSIKTNGLFSENGDAQVWFSDDDARLPVQVKTRFAHFSLTLTLESAKLRDARHGVANSKE